jgi:hypothetical protein
MRASIATLAVSVLALTVVACGPGLKAPKTADGSKIGLYILHDRNISADADEAKAKMRTQMSEYFEANLANVLTKYDYEIHTITAADQFTPGPNKFLMDVKVSSYNPGDKGKRIAGAFVGGWAGQSMASSAEARLAIEYKLTGEKGKVASTDFNEGSGTSDWQVACNNVTRRILQGTSKSLQKLYGGK